MRKNQRLRRTKTLKDFRKCLASSAKIFKIYASILTVKFSRCAFQPTFIFRDKKNGSPERTQGLGAFQTRDPEIRPSPACSSFGTPLPANRVRPYLEVTS